jgi:flagellar biosynthesis protein FliQ
MYLHGGHHSLIQRGGAIVNAYTLIFKPHMCRIILILIFVTNWVGKSGMCIDYWYESQKARDH